MYRIVTWPRNAWSLLDDMESLQSDMNRTVSDMGRGARGGLVGNAYPRMNIWSSQDGLVVDAELPGVEPGEVEVSVLGDELTVKGKLNVLQPAGEVTYHRMERPSGEFVRTLKLPFRADAGAVKANYKNGVLRLTVPRCKEDQPKKIEITA